MYTHSTLQQFLVQILFDVGENYPEVESFVAAS